MAEVLRFHRLVPSDLKGALRWYDAISINLGHRFRVAVDACLDEIERDSSHFGTLDGGIYYARVERFPYLVLFQRERLVVYVLGVMHTASDPAKWQQRTEL